MIALIERTAAGWGLDGEGWFVFVLLWIALLSGWRA